MVRDQGVVLGRCEGRVVECFGGERDGHPCISLEGWVKLRGVVYLTPHLFVSLCRWACVATIVFRDGGWALIRVAVHQVEVERGSSWLPLSDR